MDLERTKKTNKKDEGIYYLAESQKQQQRLISVLKGLNDILKTCKKMKPEDIVRNREDVLDNIEIKEEDYIKKSSEISNTMYNLYDCTKKLEEINVIMQQIKGIMNTSRPEIFTAEALYMHNLRPEIIAAEALHIHNSRPEIIAIGQNNKDNMFSNIGTSDVSSGGRKRKNKTNRKRRKYAVKNSKRRI